MTTKVAPKTACNPSSPERQRALAQKRAQLAKNGITDAQRAAGHGLLSQRLYDQIEPVGYFEKERNRSVIGTGLKVLFNPIAREHPRASREDAWATYLGLPQRNGSLQISADVPPGMCPSPEHEIYKFADIDQSDATFVAMMVRKQRGLNALAQQGWSKPVADSGKEAQETGRFHEIDHHFGFDLGGVQRFGPMGHFTATFGRDDQGEYVDYRDFWDLDPKIMGHDVPAELIAGNPFDIYGRVHFDRQKVERALDLEDELLARCVGAQFGVDVSSVKAAFLQNDNPFAMEDKRREIREAFKTGLPEELRPYAEELARLDPRYPTPVFSKDAPYPTRMETPTRGPPVTKATPISSKATPVSSKDVAPW